MRVVYGQPRCDQYWLRLDPTPGSGGTGEPSGGGVRQVLDLAQNIWDDYVVEMDSQRQDEAMGTSGGYAPMSSPYSSMIRSLTDTLARIRAGDLRGGALATPDRFSWPAAAMGVTLGVLGLMVLRIRLPAWIRRRFPTKIAAETSLPSIDFYVEALELLGRVGVTRRQEQTPRELAESAVTHLDRLHPGMPSIAKPLAVITDAFYRRRYGADSTSEVAVSDALHELRETLAGIGSESDGEATP